MVNESLPRAPRGALRGALAAIGRFVRMARRPTTLERAFELAQTGEHAGISDIKQRLKAEGYENIDAQLFGRGLARQLRTICQDARAQRQVD
jgi:hypothetical protein